MTTHYRISYVVTTYNKLPFFRHVLDRLVAARQDDEEIVVADGASTDGTPEYLRELYESGKIQQYVSERDKSQAHGINKCLLMARGDILKIINDDDAFYYPAIREAATYMQENPEIDVVMGYNAATQVEDLTFAKVKEDPAKDFRRWLDYKQPFWMIDLPLLIRRKSLPLTGLFFTGVAFLDTDFTFRITSLGVNIAWCTAVLSMHVSHPNGTFNRMSVKRRTEEFERIRDFYIKVPSRGVGAVIRDSIEAAKRPMRPAKRALFERFNLPQYQDPERFQTGYVPQIDEDILTATYRICDSFLASQNQNRPVEFISKLKGANSNPGVQ
ncbi:glycosyltransferase [Hymenobacter antarcticus]|uniref:Glycosyltransferase 2-like domain-containing protein n=1 Tax=Hymenobacter antarcticus TaxID=486270 RepID=A0ABP7R865_9BACT